MAEQLKESDPLNMSVWFAYYPIKRKNRFLFYADFGNTLSDPEAMRMFPPLKSARPSISFNEIKLEHISETITMPGKPEWQTLEVTLYELVCGGRNAVFDWLKNIYDPNKGKYKYLINKDGKNYKIPKVVIEMVNGHGQTLEYWVYEGAYPQKIDFGELNMAEGDVVTVDISFRYDRAYRQNIGGTD